MRRSSATFCICVYVAETVFLYHCLCVIISVYMCVHIRFDSFSFVQAKRRSLDTLKTFKSNSMNSQQDSHWCSNFRICLEKYRTRFRASSEATLQQRKKLVSAEEIQKTMRKLDAKNIRTKSKKNTVHSPQM